MLTIACMAPWAFGGVEPWAEFGLDLGIALLAILGAIISAVNLESHFRPKLLRKQQLQIVLDELFVALISSVV